MRYGFFPLLLGGALIATSAEAAKCMTKAEFEQRGDIQMVELELDFVTFTAQTGLSLKGPATVATKRREASADSKSKSEAERSEEINFYEERDGQYCFAGKFKLFYHSAPRAEESVKGPKKPQ